MRLTLELEGDKPLYQQIRDQIIEGLALGQLQPEESLPATRQLAMEFGINFHTVNKAYDMLRQEGVIRLNRKSGAVIAVTSPTSDFHANWASRLRTLLAEAHVKGIGHDEILSACEEALRPFRSVD